MIMMRLLLAPEGESGNTPDDKEGLDPSPDPNTDDKPSGDEPEEPDPSPEGEPEEPEEPDPENPDEPKEPEDPEADPESPKDPDPEPDPDAKLPFNNHPRWKQVLTERNTAQEEAARLKPKAELADTLSNFCQSNGISREDLQQALELAALAKKDTKAFRQRIGQMVEDIDVSQGTRLPADLQKKVDDGIVDQTTAMELAQARMRLNGSQRTAQSATEQAAAQLQQSIVSGLNTWEASVKQKDPGWDKRKEMFQDRLTTLWTRQPPASVQDAINLAEQANKETKERVSKFVPKPAKRKPPLSSFNAGSDNGQDLKLDSLDDLGSLVKAVATRHR